MYGINLKNGNVLVLGQAMEYRKGTPVFGRYDADSNAVRVMTAAVIKTNWRAWASDLFSDDERVSQAEAEKRGIEIL